MEENPDRYPRCAQIPKQQFINEVNEEIAKSLGESFDLLPLFESGMNEHAFKKHNSITRNPLLKCRWDEYKKNKVERPQPRAPMELPDIKNTLHFYNCALRFVPSASIKYQDHRMKLKPGPGVDLVGQMPIPQEALMKRGTAVKTFKNDKQSKNSGSTKEKKEKSAKEG